MGYVKLNDSGLIGEASLAEAGDGLHDEATGTPLVRSDGAGGPHVIHPDGSFSWVKAWPTADGDYESLVESEDGWMFFVGLDDYRISDEDEVVFHGEGRPEESKAEYFSEQAVSEGWDLDDWTERFVGGSSSWPTWKEDVLSFGFPGVGDTLVESED